MSVRSWLAFTVLVGCSGDGGPDVAGTDSGSLADTAVPPAFGELSAVVGPDGGSIDGDGELGFEGFHLEIPAGALDGDTTVTVRLTSVAAPLPTLGEECGQSYEIDGGGATLDAPMQVTLPVDPSTVAAWGRGDDDVQVWFTEDEAEWTGILATDTTRGSVTFDAPAFGAAAPGVFRIVLPDLCLGGSCVATTNTPTTNPCASGAFCLETLRAGGQSAAPESGARLVTDGTNVFWTTRPATGQVAIARFAPTGAALDVSLPYSTPSTTRRNLATAPRTDEVWLGIGIGGNVRFKFQGAVAAVFDSNVQGFGGVGFPDGTFTRLSSSGAATRPPGSQTFGAASTGDLGNGLSLSSFRFGSASEAWGRTAVFGYDEPVPEDRLVTFTPDTPPHFVALARGLLESPLDLRPALGLSPTLNIAFAAFPQVGGNQVLVIHASGARGFVDALFAQVDAAVDPSNDLWLASANTPELVRIQHPIDPANRSIERIPLTTAAPGTATYSNKVPRSLVALRDGRIIVQTANGELVAVRRPGG